MIAAIAFVLVCEAYLEVQLCFRAASQHAAEVG